MKRFRSKDGLPPPPKQEKKQSCGICRALLKRIRRLRPSAWLTLLSAALLLFTLLTPRTFWIRIAAVFRAHRFTVLLVLLFTLICISMVWKGGQKIDARIFCYFNTRSGRSRWMDRTMRSVTEFGNGMVTGAIAVILFFYRSRQLSYEFIFGTLTLWTAVELMKMLFRRERPFLALSGVRVVGVRARGNSFPSGHTSQAFYTAAVITRHAAAAVPFVAAVYLLAALVGVTRMYLGMHYPRDVLAGAILGSCWGLVSALSGSYLFG